MKTYTKILLICCSILQTIQARAEFDISPSVVNNRIVTGATVDEEPGAPAPRFVFPYNFGEDEANPFVIEDPGVNAFNGNGLPQGSSLLFDFRSDLRFWNGTGNVQFTPVPSGETLTLAKENGPGSATAGTGTGVSPGFAIGTAALGGSLHQHLESTLSGGANQTEPAEGIYLVQLQLRSSNETIKNSLPFFLLYNNGLDELTTFPAAQTWVEDNLLPLGDFDRDGSFAAADIRALLVALTDVEKYRTDHELSSADLLAFGDMNGDGRISNLDLQTLLNLLAETSGAGSLNPVPEPSTLLLLALGAVAVWSTKRQNLQRKFI